ncbi:MAG: deoxynucleoside kinase [Anaerolineae bacterium]
MSIISPLKHSFPTFCTIAFIQKWRPSAKALRQSSGQALRLGSLRLYSGQAGQGCPYYTISLRYCQRRLGASAHVLALHDMKMLSLRDYRAYRELYDLVIETLPPPDLLVYLQASVPTLMERIGQRGRGMESGITADYLERLDALYAEWIEGFNLCPVLTVSADDPDFVTHLQIISERILDKLQGKEEVVFPEM